MTTMPITSDHLTINRINDLDLINPIAGFDVESMDTRIARRVAVKGITFIPCHLPNLAS